MSTTALVVFLCAAVTSAPACQSLGASPYLSPSPLSSVTRPIETPQEDQIAAPTAVPSFSVPGTLVAPGEPVGRARLGVADGALPAGVTVFDDGYPGLANLDPDLLQAVREAATDAASDGVTFYVSSGWRSSKFQERLLREALAEYGSEGEAARWVAPPDSSTHVSGDAIDIGPSDAMAWLSEQGARYGLCQIYRNEPWHFELRPVAIDRGCPPMYLDPAHDPRMQQ